MSSHFFPWLSVGLGAGWGRGARLAAAVPGRAKGKSGTWFPCLCYPAFLRGTGEDGREPVGGQTRGHGRKAKRSQGKRLRRAETRRGHAEDTMGWRRVPGKYHPPALVRRVVRWSGLDAVDAAFYRIGVASGPGFKIQCQDYFERVPEI
jgi:hypothetical protein